jgi:ferritin
VLEAFDDMVGVQMKIEEQTKVVIDVADSEKDYATRIFVEKFYVDTVLLYTKQVLMLQQAVKDYSEEGLLPLFDSNIENYIIIPEL